MQIKFPTQEKTNLFSWGVFFWEHKERIASGLMVVLVGAIFLARSVTGKESNLGDYLQASIYQAQLKGREGVDSSQLIKLLKKHPELKPTFAPHLEQTFAIEGDIVQAKRVSEETLKRLSFIEPLYCDYAKTSLLIEGGKYEEALERSLKIKGAMQRDESPNLYGLNMIRISFLESLLGRKEKGKWEESTLSSELISHLKDDKLSLIDFVR